MLRKLLSSLVLFASTTSAFAGDMTFKYGIGVFLKDANSAVEVKFFSLGYQSPIWNLFRQKVELGLWADTRTGEGHRHSSGFASYSLGVSVEGGRFYASSFWGGSYITHTDSLLSTNFEFAQDLSVGLKDDAGRALGVTYKHFSNAGIKLPNKGRDFFVIDVRVPIGN